MGSYEPTIPIVHGFFEIRAENLFYFFFVFSKWVGQREMLDRYTWTPPCPIFILLFHCLSLILSSPVSLTVSLSSPRLQGGAGEVSSSRPGGGGPNRSKLRRMDLRHHRNPPWSLPPLPPCTPSRCSSASAFGAHQRRASLLASACIEQASSLAVQFQIRRCAPPPVLYSSPVSGSWQCSSRSGCWCTSSLSSSMHLIAVHRRRPHGVPRRYIARQLTRLFLSGTLRPSHSPQEHLHGYRHPPSSSAQVHRPLASPAFFLVVSGSHLEATNEGVTVVGNARSWIVGAKSRSRFVDTSDRPGTINDEVVACCPNLSTRRRPCSTAVFIGFDE